MQYILGRIDHRMRRSLKKRPRCLLSRAGLVARGAECAEPQKGRGWDQSRPQRGKLPAAWASDPLAISALVSVVLLREVRVGCMSACPLKRSEVDGQCCSSGTQRIWRSCCHQRLCGSDFGIGCVMAAKQCLVIQMAVCQGFVSDRYELWSQICTTAPSIPSVSQCATVRQLR